MKSPSKPPWYILEEKKEILKCIWNHNRSWITKIILTKRTTLEGLPHKTLSYITIEVKKKNGNGMKIDLIDVSINIIINNLFTNYQ